VGPVEKPKFKARNLILATINRKRATLMVDSGAVVSVISKNFLTKMGISVGHVIEPEALVAADGRNLRVIGTVELTVGLNGLLVPHVFYVIDGLNREAIIGLDFLHLTKCQLDLVTGTVSFFDGLVSLPLQHRSSDEAVIRAIERVEIPPGTEALIPVRIPPKFVSSSKTALLEPHVAMLRQGCLVARMVIRIDRPQTMCRIFNPMDRKIMIRKGSSLATIAFAEVGCVAEVDSPSAQDMQYKEQKGQVSREEKERVLTGMGIELNRDKVDSEIYDEFCDLLYEFKDIFALSLRDLTGANVPESPILIRPGAKPARSRPYRLNDEMRREVDKQLDQMISAGIITESQGSQFAAPLVMVRKSSGEWRMCADYRKLNASLYPLYHSLPLVDDVIDLLARNQVKRLSVLDFRSAYFQLPTTKSTRPFTTFITPHRGCYQMERLAMGINQSPYYMMQTLSQIFRYQIGTFLCVYLDDLILASDSERTHLKHLRIVFEKLRKFNLKLHPKKCQFMLEELRYLGFIFNTEGYKVDSRKTEIIRNFPRPQNTKDVRSFLGLANYCRKMIDRYADKAYALTKLLRHDVVFHWGPEQEKSFQQLKDSLTTSPVMALPDFSKEMILTTDASDVSISYNLSQIIDGKERFLEYAGRGLRKAELNYSATEKELLSVVMGVSHYHEFLQPKPFLVRTDNIAIKYLGTVKHVTGRLGRWNLLLQNYVYRVEHLPGKVNVPADVISRIPLPVPETGVEEALDDYLMSIDRGTEEDDGDRGAVWEITIPASVNEIEEKGENEVDDDEENETSHEQLIAPDEEVSLDVAQSYDIAALQAECPDTRLMIDYLSRGILPTDNDALARKLVFEAERYVCTADGVLWHLKLPKNKRQKDVDFVVQQLVIPRKLRALVLKTYHEHISCHIGPEKMYHTIANKYYWKGMYIDVFEWARTCVECQKGKNLGSARAPMKSLQIEATIFSRWHIDHTCIRRSGEYNYVLVVIDSFSLYPLLLPARTTSAEETADLLYNHLFMVYGCRTLLSDRGSAFRSKLVQHLCKLLGVKQIFTSPRRPQTNSRCESFNKNILNALRTQCNEAKDWPSLLPTIAYAFRTAVVPSLGFSPYRIVYGIEPHNAFDNMLFSSAHNVPTNVGNYVRQMEPQLKLLREAVRRNQESANERTRQIYNSKANTKTPQFKVLDRVWLHNPVTKGEKLAHKTAQKWTGPFLILDSDDFNTYKLQDCRSQKIWHARVHADRLRACRTDRDRFYADGEPDSADGDLVMPSAEPIQQQERLAMNSSRRELPTAATAVWPTEFAASSGNTPTAAATAATEAVAGNIAAELRRPASSTTAHATTPVNPLPVATGSNATDDRWFEITDILNHRRRGNAIYYNVRWADGSTTWLPRKDVTDYAIDIYWVNRTQRPRRRRKRRT